MSIFEKLRTYPSPKSTLTQTCYQLTGFGLREGWVCNYSDTDINLRKGGRGGVGMQVVQLLILILPLNQP